MPLDVSRVLDSDLFALATGEEFKAAIALWCKSWLQVPAASLPNDDRVLAHLSGAGSRWKKVKDMALRGFILCNDGRLYHTVVAEKARTSWEKRASYKERSKKGNAKRWGVQEGQEQQSQSYPSGIAKGLLELPKGEGEGEGYIPLDKSNGAAPNSDKAFWDAAKTYLSQSGVSNPGALIGKWCRDHSKDEAARSITAAQVERAVDPVSFITATLRGGTKKTPVKIGI
jgi:Protein of unknown function (DUF1376)